MSTTMPRLGVSVVMKKANSLPTQNLAGKISDQPRRGSEPVLTTSWEAQRKQHEENTGAALKFDPVSSKKKWSTAKRIFISKPAPEQMPKRILLNVNA